MLFVSTACLKYDRIGEVVEVLAQQGFRNVELSSGTAYYDDLEKDLLRLQADYNLTYVVHNYFPPPPRDDFVINLAAVDDEIYQRSIQQLKASLAFCRRIGAKKFGFHAGYFVHISVDEVGQALKEKPLADKDQAIGRFCHGFTLLAQEARGIDLYVENNVYSQTNYAVYHDQNPLMLLQYRDYVSLKKMIDFKLLLDLGHLNVTVTTLKLDRELECDALMEATDYIHVSDNNGLSDQHRSIAEGSRIADILRRHTLRDKIVTLEIGGTIADLKRCCEVVLSAIER